MASETRNKDIDLLTFELEDFYEINVPVKLSYNQFRVTHFFWSPLDAISETGGLIAIGKVILAIAVPFKVFFFIQGLAQMIRRKERMKMRILEFKNILEHFE